MSDIKARLKAFDELCLRDQLMEASNPMWLNHCRNLLAELEKAKKVTSLCRSRCQEIITKSDNREDNIIYIQNALSKYKEGE